MMNIYKNILILIVVSVSTYYSSVLFGNWYEKLFMPEASIFGAVDLRGLIGLPLSFIFSTTLFFTAFGGEKKYWWIGILLISAVAFELYLDLAHIYFPIILGFAGWLSGLLAFKLLTKINKFYAADKTIH